MKWRELFSKKKEQKKSPEAAPQPKPEPPLVFGTLGFFPLESCEDVVVRGTVQGTVKKGDAVYVCNPGEDEGAIFLTTVTGIETAAGGTVERASGVKAALRLEQGKKYLIKKGTVVFHRNASTAAVHQAYVSALGDAFVASQKLELSERDRESMSLTDCAEVWRLFSWFRSTISETESQKQKSEENRDKLGALMCKKLLAAKEIYCVVNRKTGEPHLFSHTIPQQGSYECTPPDICILTKAYKADLEKQYPEDRIEIRKIENGENGDGIKNFLADAFYLNGACGVGILFEQASVGAEALVPKPDYSGVDPRKAPVTNPAVMRWMLLLNQMGQPETESERVVCGVYHRFLALALREARFLVPVRRSGPPPNPAQNESRTLQKGDCIEVFTGKGKGERDAVRLYTDWKRLREGCGPEWNAVVQPIDELIGRMDCAINVTAHPESGYYLDEEMYRQIKAMQ